ncbi:MAG: tetrathionate reductase family octaheme c-type cytochrome [Desulfobacteraceae bacterium]|nr:tetrathionate reductase family octaheme c-type cytochrome [Desulfobacteraceae bacterium]
MAKGLLILKSALIFTIIFGLLWTLPIQASTKTSDEALGRKLAKQAVRAARHWTTTDHSKIKILNQDFNSGNDITKACLSCHNDAASQFHKTIHWTWKVPSDKQGVLNGKAGHAVNNFCISGNDMKDKGCLKCHAGWEGTKAQVNCLKCHGSKFNYKEAFEDIEAFKKEDDPESKEIIKDIYSDIRSAVKNLTLPRRQNCGECHFKGGGGDGVKHGDLDTSLTKPNKSLDVHMAAEGQNFTCTRCHTTVKHHIAGRVYTRPAAAERKSLIQDDMATKITCESCHGVLPHKNDSKMNDHVDKVACQACHIPEYARINPTKMWWDWTKAGKKKDGKAYVEKGPFGKPVYKSIKGEFKWEKNVIPEYFWYNGSFSNTTIKETIDPGQIVKVSHPIGEMTDPDSRIHPFKVHRGKQPYDKVHKKLVAPILSGKNGFFTTLDMPKSIDIGQKALNEPYSGEFDYVETTYAFPITHMVAPRENALSCTQCHIREESRLASITGIYLPGRDKSDYIDALGWIAVIGALGGVCLHGLGRFFTRNGRKD